MTLNELRLIGTYRTSDNNLLEEFYIPCLTSSIMYDRAVGYFNSSILNYIANGLYPFIKNGGKMRLICGVELSKADIESIMSSFSAEKIISDNLSKQVDSVLEDPESGNIKNLCWLIKAGKLEIKVAIRNFGDREQCKYYHNLHTIYHEKFGIFTDSSNNKVVFAGSLNESVNGWIYNFESFDVFWDWQSEFLERVQNRVEYFERLWTNSTLGVKIYDFPTALKEKLVKIAPEEPIDQLYRFGEPQLDSKHRKIVPRDYQISAVTQWKLNGYKGMFEMATGTGKTITAILCAEEFIKNHSSVLVIIVCPYQHLVDQWREELMRFGYIALSCYESRKKWENVLVNDIIDLNIGLAKFKFIITTSVTASMESFLSALNRVRDNTEVLIIGDEAHNLGANCRQSILKDSFKGRIGLSATPSRWHDDSGTEILNKYFGKVVFSYDLKEAIAKGNLTPYDYFPVLVELTRDEFEIYQEISVKIAKMLASGVSEDDDFLARIMMQRAEVVNNAENKINEFTDLVKLGHDLAYTLIYTSPGQIETIQKILVENNIFFQRFTSKESNNERQRILLLFSEGDVDVLVAMHCLDEGVDVPATRKAFIFASSTNPKEFIQRRGRVLRKYPGKDKAIIYDFIAVPPYGVEVLSATRSLVKRELTRFKEFADLALNKFQARSKVIDLANYYNLLDEV